MKDETLYSILGYLTILVGLIITYLKINKDLAIIMIVFGTGWFMFRCIDNVRMYRWTRELLDNYDKYNQKKKRGKNDKI